MAEEKIAIYAMTHKDFVPPSDPIYVPLHVGRALYLRRESIGTTSVEKNGSDSLSVTGHPENSSELTGIMRFLGDDTGDNISARNDNFSELTGHYYVWKNDKASDIIGTCHYRRYLISDKTGDLLTSYEIKTLLKKYDIITTKNLLLNFPYEYGFGEHHKPLYLTGTGDVLKDLYPKDHAVFEKLIKEEHTYFGNMLICRREIFEDYSDWLFSILFELDKRITIDEPDSYHRRIYGFISEFLLYVYIVSRGLKAKECKVGMTAEKTEVTAIKKRLAEYFKQGDYIGAREYFLEQKKLRPDITMEASDITGELHLSMQAIATAGLEDKEYGDHILNRIRDFDELMTLFNTLNKYTVARLNGKLEASESQWIRDNHITPVAISVSEEMFKNVGNNRVLINKTMN